MNIHIVWKCFNYRDAELIAIYYDKPDAMAHVKKANELSGTDKYYEATHVMHGTLQDITDIEWEGEEETKSPKPMFSVP